MLGKNWRSSKSKSISNQPTIFCGFSYGNLLILLCSYLQIKEIKKLVVDLKYSLYFFYAFNYGLCSKTMQIWKIYS